MRDSDGGGVGPPNKEAPTGSDTGRGPRGQMANRESTVAQGVADYSTLEPREVEPYPFDTDFEHALVVALASVPEVWDRIGGYLEVDALSGGKNAPPRLLARAAREIWRDTGCGPTSNTIVMQRVRFMYNDGKITIDQLNNAIDYLSGFDGELPTTDQIVSEVARELKQRMHHDAMLQMHEVYAGNRRSEDVRATLERADSIGKAGAVVMDPWVIGDGIEITPREWLWRGRLPAGELALIEGLGGLGKGTVMADIAARVTSGRAMPGEIESCAPRSIVWISSEETTKEVGRRLRAAGADMGRCIIRHEAAERWSTHRGADELAALLRKHDAALVVIDALKDHLRVGKGGEDAVREALHPLVGVAHRTGAAIVGVRHWTKAAAAARERGAGSTAYRDVARSVLQLGQPPDGEELALAHEKSNYAKCTPTLALAIQVVSDDAGETAPTIAWGEEIEVTANDIATHDLMAESRSRGRNRRRTGGLEARDALRHVLAAGFVPATEAKERAAQIAGVSLRTIERAARSLGVDSKPAGLGQPWVWSLPLSHQNTGESGETGSNRPSVPESEDSPGPPDGETGDDGEEEREAGETETGKQTHVRF